jgi:long-chain acyl-CoA synthetase
LVDHQSDTNHQRKEVEMVATTWPTSNWPEGVAHDVTDYEKPLFSILDDSAREYPNQVYTIFNDATRTYAQVKDTADRIANFLVSRGIQKDC